MARVPARPLSGSGLQGALDLLTPPFAAAAGHQTLPLVGGRLTVEGPRRLPALLVRLRVPLARSAVVVRAAVGGVDQDPVVLGAWSAEGSTLPLYVPDLPEGSETTGTFEAVLRVWRLDGAAAAEAHDATAVLERLDAGGAGVTGPLGPDDASALLEGVVLEGTLARVVYLATLEKQRLLASAREVAAGRDLSLARASALDGHGLDLGVPRLEGEDDEDYRARLAIYSSWRLATPTGFAEALNGPAGAGPSTGLPSRVGVTSRFRVVPPTERLAVAVRLVEVTAGGPQRRDRFAQLLTSGLLMDLQRVTSRSLPAGTRTRLEEARTTLRRSLVAAPGDTRYLGVLTAVTLARVVRLLEGLTGDGSLELHRAWTPAEDPRHELGLGVTVTRVQVERLRKAATAVRKVQDAVAAGDRVELPGATGRPDPELVETVLGLQPRGTDVDPLGEWLLTGAGMATVVAGEGRNVYLSPLPTFGLAVEGTGTVAPKQDLQLTARVRPDTVAGRHVLAQEAADRAVAALEELGAGQALLAPEDLQTVLEKVVDAGDPLPAALADLAATGLAPAVPAELARRVLEVYDLDLLCGFEIDVRHDSVTPGSAEAAELVADVTSYLDALVAAGFHSVRALPRGNRLMLLGALSVLPGGANRPGEPPPAAYRWYVSELPRQDPDGAPLEIRRGVGGRITLRGLRPGLALVLCVAHVRRGDADPYEVRVELDDDDALLTLDQYGYVMNLLEHLCPLGIEINTFDMRRNHVTLDGEEPTFLSSAVSRSYTRYRRRRSPGADRHAVDPVHPDLTP